MTGEGKGFEIAQGRLGPGRIHHCMRLIGMCERTIELMCDRAINRKSFGKRFIQQVHYIYNMGIWPIFFQQTVRATIAECRLEIDQCRLMVLNAAHAIDSIGTKAARKQVLEREQLL